MSRTKGKGKAARQKQRRRQKRALTKVDGVATQVFVGIAKDKLTEEGLKLRHAAKHCRNGMLGQMLFENIGARMREADALRTEKLIVQAVLDGEGVLTIPDYYIKDDFYSVNVAMMDTGEVKVLMGKHAYVQEGTGWEHRPLPPVDCTDHICTNDCDTCECVGKLGVATQLSPDDNGIVGEILVWADGSTHLTEDGSPPSWKSDDYITLDSSSKYSELSGFVGDLIAGDIATEFQIFGGVQDENSITVTIGGVTTDGNGTCE